MAFDAYQASRSLKSRQGSQSRKSDAQRKYEKAVAAGVDPQAASFAFNYVPEGQTRVVTIQGKESVGVNVTRGGPGQTTTRQTLNRQQSVERLGADYSIPTNDQGQSRLDVQIQNNKAPRYEIPGQLTYAGPYTPTTRAAVAVGVPNYQINFPVYGPPTPSEPRDTGRYGAGLIAPAPERPNNRFVPDFIERPARTFGATVRASIRDPGSIGPTLQDPTSSPAQRAGALTTVVGGIGSLAATPTILGARLGITSYLGTTGAIATSIGASAVAPSVGSRVAIRGDERDVLDDPRFNIAFEKALEARRSELGFIGRARDFIPGFGTKTTDLISGDPQARFVAEFERQRVELGLPEGSTRIAVREFEARTGFGGAGLAIAQLPGEIIGRTVFGGAGVIARPGVRAAVSTIPAGVLEGGLTFAVERSVSRQPVRPRDFAVASVAGGLFAGAASGIIVGSRAARTAFGTARANAVQGSLYAIDPLEAFGDAGADIVGGPGVRTITPTIVNGDFVNSRVFDQTTTPPKPSGTPSGTPNTGNPVVNPVRVPSVNPVSTVSRPNADSFLATNVQKPDGGSLVETRSSPTSLNPIPNTQNPVVPVNPVPVPVNPVNPVPTVNIVPTTPVNIPTQVPNNPFNPVNQVNVNQFTFTPRGGVFPFGGLSRRQGFGLRPATFAPNPRNLPSLTALVGDLKGVKKLPRSYRSTGIEIRGL